MKTLWKKTLRNFIVQSLLASLLVSFVILSLAIISWILIETYYSFYLALFFLLVIPAWLVAFGLVFYGKWSGLSMGMGGILSTFILSLLFFASAEDLSFRLINSALFSLAGAGCVVWGFTLRKVFGIIMREFLTHKKEKRSTEKPPSSLGF